MTYEGALQNALNKKQIGQLQKELADLPFCCKKEVQISDRAYREYEIRQRRDCFICAEGRKLYCRKVSTEVHNGIPMTRAWYRGENCQNCPQREKYCRKQDINEPEGWKPIIPRKKLRSK